MPCFIEADRTIDKYLICCTLAWYGRWGWGRATQSLSHVFPETLTMASPTAQRNTGPALGKHLPVFLKSSSWKPFPLQLHSLPHRSSFVMILENAHSHGTGGSWLKIMGGNNGDQRACAKPGSRGHGALLASSSTL